MSNNTIKISPNQKGSISAKELWRYRELFFFFAWRDIKVRYKQTALGVVWAVLQPFLATGIFTMFFNRVAGIGSGSANIPYPVFAYLGLMYWNCFASTLGSVSNSIVGSQGVISKIYFPRLIPPLAAGALSVVDFFFAGLAFIPLLVFFSISPGLAGVFMLVPSLALIIFGAMGMGLFFAALNVKYRDVRSIVPFLTQILLFVTPIIYPISLIPERFRIYAFLNPAAGAISAVRAGFFNDSINWLGFAMSCLGALILMVLGLYYFKKTERGFVDII
jgi:lipopolysaccharide transport system permease protein